MKYKEQYILRSEDNQRVINWINTNLGNYLLNNKENFAEIEHIIDYLKSEYAPENIIGLQYENAVANSKKWVKWLEKKAKGIVETEEDTEIFIDFRNGVKLVKLIGKAAFEREGKLMKHCVSSYFGKDGITIYSLRDINNDPHCTIEVIKDEEKINQIKGRGNGSIHPRYIKYILKALKKLGRELNDYDLRNLGYLDLGAEYYTLMEEVYCPKSIKFITIFNKKYFYKGSSLKARYE